MVLKKSIHYGRFDGFQSPLVPKAPRSLRVDLIRESSDCSAFELLADVADKLLQESESSTLTIGQERNEQIVVPAVNVKREESEVNVTVKPLKEPSESDNDSGLEHVSDVKTCDFLKKIGTNVKSKHSEGENLDNRGKNTPSHGDIYEYNLVSSIPEMKTVVGEKQSGELTFRNSCVDISVLNKSCSSVNQPSYKDPVSCFMKQRGNVKRGFKDDDDNSYRHNYRGTKMSAFRSQPRVGCRRIRKMLTSRFRKVTTMTDYKLGNPTSDGMRPFYQSRKNIYKRERRQIENAASKRRKLFQQNSSNTTYVQDASNKVKFSIQSFKVPELYIEMPETATIGSLKRTVMEAVKSILVGELDVGILVEGKKVRENDRTLQQTGISRNCDFKTLGFTLEPSFQKEPALSLPHDTNQQPSSCTSSPITDVGFSNCSMDHPSATSLDNYVDKNRQIVPFKTEVLTEDIVTDSKPLAIIPFDHTLTKKSDTSLRRIRRPFSVTEVEALVEAIEKLGTGRWRDIKQRAFEDADHRTYVDLKDKWKTLVHTASIGPHQRRGEPVPQNLLDRVLAAHRYWSNNQLK